jgi:hypothetical protein
MGTCAVLGQAAGAAAALAVRWGLRPRELGERRIRELQQQLLRDDCYIAGLRRDDADDLAPRARVTASSVAAVEMTSGEERAAVPPALAQGFVAGESRLDAVALYLESAGRSRATAALRLHRSESLTCLRSQGVLAESPVTGPEGGSRWVTVSLAAQLEPGAFYFLELEPRDRLVVWLASPEELPGTQRALWSTEERRWVRRRGTLCFRLMPAQQLYRPEWVTSGVARPEERPNLWVSEAGLPQWLGFEFAVPTTVRELHVTFDTDLGRKFLTEIPEVCVKHYALERLSRECWQTVVEEAANHQRHRRHRFPPVTSLRYRLRVLETWGRPEARVYEVRLYG